MTTRTITIGPGFRDRPAPSKSPEQIYQDRAYAAGELREVVEPDRTGRQITRFYGDPAVTWSPFKLPHRRVRGLGPK